MGRVNAVDPDVGAIIKKRFVAAKAHIHQFPAVMVSPDNIGLNHPPVIRDRIHLPYYVIPQPETIDHPVETGYSGAYTVMHGSPYLLPDKRAR